MRKADLSVSGPDDDCADSCTVFPLEGRADIEDCSWLRDLLQLQAQQDSGRVVLDLSHLSSMDWWVALILVRTGRVIRRRGGTLVLSSPQPAVARLLSATAARQAPDGDKPPGKRG